MSAERPEQTALRLREQARRADRLQRAVCGRFVAGAERALALQAARESGVEADFDGGWAEAERMQVCFHPPGVPPESNAVWAVSYTHLTLPTKAEV